MKAIIYEIAVDGDDGIEGTVMRATLAEAKAIRAAQYYPNGEITRTVTADLPIRELLVAMFNRVGYAAESEVVVGPMTREDRG